MSGWEKRAVVSTSHGDNDVEGVCRDLLEGFGAMLGEVVTHFLHGADRARIYSSRWVGARGVWLDDAFTVHPREGLRHLAPVRIFRADEEHCLQWRLANRSFVDGPWISRRIRRVLQRRRTSVALPEPLRIPYKELTGDSLGKDAELRKHMSRNRTPDLV